MLKNRKALASAEKELQEGKTQLARAKAQAEANKPYMSPEQIAAAQKRRSRRREKNFRQTKKSSKKALHRLPQAKDRLKNPGPKLKRALQNTTKEKMRRNQHFPEAEAEFADARKELAEAEEEIRDIKAPDTYVLDRNTNIGYACFESDSGIIDGIAKVFPVFFFYGSGTGMYDNYDSNGGRAANADWRSESPFGYGNGAVISKYLFYAASASFIGCIIGFFSSRYIFPLVIWNAYGMMYDFSGDLYYIIDGVLFAISLSVSLLCSMGATMLSCYAEFREVPAQLIRPKAPKEGKSEFFWNGFLLSGTN